MSDDSIARLRRQYGAQGGVGAVFSTRVVHYVASLPNYPAALFDCLSALGVLPPNAEVADIGAGTGLLTRDVLAVGHTVVAVEPSDKMRGAADRLWGSHPHYRSVAGTAEASTFTPQSVDLITAAQAVHWFDMEPAERECLRILRLHGQVVLIWNGRVLADPLHAALNAVFVEFGGDKRAAMRADEERTPVPRFFGSPASQLIDLPHERRASFDGLVSLAVPRSYIPALNGDAGKLARRRVAAVFAVRPWRLRRDALSLRRVHVSVAGLSRRQASIQRDLVVATSVMNGQC